MSDRLRERAIALYTFLKEFAELRSEVVRHLDRYDEVLWLDEIPRERECYSAAWRGGRDEAETEAWIEIRKPRLVRAPTPPDELRPWLIESEWQDSENELPRLRDEVALLPPEEGEHAIQARLAENPRVQSLWEHYIEDRWWPWREEDRRAQAVQRVYTNLFRVYQKQQRLGEQYEVVVGLGLLKWALAGGLAVERHLVVTTASVQFDAKRGVIAVGPPADGVKPRLEQDMLEPSERPPVDDLRAIEAQMDGIGDGIWDPIQVDAALASWANSASSLGSYSREGSRTDPVTRNPQVVFSPALILRRRTERSFIRAFQEILRQLQSGAPVPDAVARFVDVTEVKRATGDVGEVRRAQDVTETYFPLEANDDQLRIVERLSGHDGVLVQGPPGTGKSHTVVNLVCHLLASGQRVLVTSHTARALQVLKRYIATRVPEIAPLAVLLLGEGSDALQAMEDSVQGITQKQNHWDNSQAAVEIGRAEKTLTEAREQEARVLRDLRSIRERETFQHTGVFDAYDGSLSKIGDRLRAEATTLDWIGDAIPEDLERPLSQDEFIELVALERRRDVRKFEDAAWRLPGSDDVPSATDFEALLAREDEARRSVQSSLPGRDHQDFTALAAAPPDAIAALQDAVSRLLRTFDSLARHFQRHWAERAGIEVLGGNERTWRELREATSAHIAVLKPRAAWADDNPIAGIERHGSLELKRDAEDLRSHLEQGGRLGWGPFRTRTVKKSLYIVEGVLVGGRRCRTLEAVTDLAERLVQQERLKSLRGMWNSVCPLRGRTVVSVVAELEDLSEPLETALSLHEQASAVRATLNGIRDVSPLPWHEISTVKEFSVCLQAVSAKRTMQGVEQEAAVLLTRLTSVASVPNITPALLDLAQAFNRRDAAAYRAGLRTLADQSVLGSALERQKDLQGRLSAVAPRLAESLRADAEAAIWDNRASQFETSWLWSRAKSWLTRLADPAMEQQLQVRRSAARERVKKMLAEIAGLLAWRHCFSRMTEHERQHLVAWAKSVRAVGKGTGKYAPLHRANAREHLNECRSAIPAWVMPLYRVAETIQPGSELFDVVIVDEASQSGPEALLLAYLAKKLIVVGDDKQISPSHVGVDREDVIHLRNRHLTDLPHRDAYGLEQSFFDLAEIRYPGRIRLREHFRCMPEIIQFSNRLCYAAEPLIPLRQYGANRLDPVVMTRQVGDGYLKGVRASVMNPPEAEAVATWVQEALQDPKYAGKTFGVISLLGEAQAAQIQQLLLQRIGPEEMENHELVCGDAYAFQGDERDVMVLSLVSALDSERRIGTLTTEADRRRFNVAASRARDQMVLFHSASLGDLSPKCFRYQLLDYCQNPAPGWGDVPGVSLEQIAQLAATADRRFVRPPDPFDSWFEVDVYLKICGKGYRALPQHEAAGYRLDLVVESMRSRVAVECDGDFWHGPERYEQDAARQRVLERCGWTFCRIRGSAFAIDPEAAMEPVWKTLAAQEVQASQARRPTPWVAEANLPREPSAQVPVPAPSRDRERQPNLAGVVLDLLDEAEAEQPDPPMARAESAAYSEWPIRPLPDPTEARLTDVVAGLVSIVEHEGPMTVQRACQVFVKASGGQRVGKNYRTALHRALHRAERDGYLVTRDELHVRDFDEWIVRLTGAPVAIVRRRGPREFSEIPASELAALMQELSAKEPALTGIELYREVLGFYETRRMTENIAKTLQHVDNNRHVLLFGAAPGPDNTPAKS
ncbi:MAG: hypothetical protein A3G76_11445 [Acidobacteria bacterium RIFCSPLOWO2_12_FULL_65_11]|nr:MAG: hypothetical protein A3H95_10060 [Acidobacteria bacterium RIFCSPLOWO2_02_FULL_64_15]OFW29232.1 MAG: hypothetical protein A3G76_11445 [Acidobacteria bacterium RIFCSPLOWO2_12_FULL_65_11]